MKKWLALLLVAFILFSFVACDDAANNSSNGGNSGSGGSKNAVLPPAEAVDTSGDISSETVQLHVIQVMAKGKNSDSGELFSMDKFIAGKSTVVVARFADAREIPQDGSLTLSVTRDGNELLELLPLHGGESLAAMFVPRDIKDLNSWEEGVYKFALNEGGSTVASRSARFSKAKSIKVLAVPVIANYGGEAVSCEGEWKTGLQMTQDTYPLADNGIEIVFGSELDLSDNKYDLKTQEGMYETWQALANLQTKNNDYELVLGYVRNRQGEDGGTQGYTYGLPANIITESDGDMRPTVAHEIAHCYNIGDEYDGGTLNYRVNPAPFGMEGSDWKDREKTVASQKQAVKRVESHSGSLISSDEQMPFNVRTMEALGDVGSWMGSGSENENDYWITSDIWNHLFSAFVYNDPNVEPYGDDGGNTQKNDPDVPPKNEEENNETGGEEQEEE